jgi:hypothetical protein
MEGSYGDHEGRSHREPLSTWKTTYPWPTTVLDAGFTKLAEASNAAALPIMTNRPPSY